MKIWVTIISISSIIFLAGCTIGPTKQIMFKNDVVTIENYNVDDVAPYSDTVTAISFDIQNNADTKIPSVNVNFFDVPGFEITDLKCPKIKGNDKNMWPDKQPICTFTDLEPLDARHISLTLKARTVNSPTPYTVSFSVSYNHKGAREALIPIIDGVTKKEPSFQFSQSETSLGPIYFDIQPQLEREKILDGKTTKVYWGVTGNQFLTKFVMKDRSSISDTVKQTNMERGAIHMITQNLESTGACDFLNGNSNIAVNTVFNTISCNFKPTGTGSEYTSTIKIDFVYQYEFIKSQNFVIQPKPFGGG